MIIHKHGRKSSFVNIATNIRATIFNMKQHKDLSKKSINQWTGYRIEIISQTYRFFFIKTANNIPVTKIQIKWNKIYIYVSKVSINGLNIRKCSVYKHIMQKLLVLKATNIRTVLIQTKWNNNKIVLGE